jgi:hypothetical protein
MPKYTFVCPDGHTDQKYVPRLCMDVECSVCHQKAQRQMPTLNGPSNVTEVIDKYTGITHRRDQKEEVQARREEYYWTVEVPRFVQSGTYTLETMLENGWVWVDDNLQIHTHTKPPHRR